MSECYLYVYPQTAMRITFSLLLIFFYSFNVHCKQDSNATLQEEVKGEVRPLTAQSVTLMDDKVGETSGLLHFDNSIWTINDSGNPNVLYRINPQTGAVIAEIRISNSANVDWEELTQDENFIYIADIGDNLAKREEKHIYRVRKTDVIQAKNGESVNSEKIIFTYPDVNGSKISYDAEALISYNGSLHLFTKDLFETNHFTVSKEPGRITAKFVEKFKTNGQVTGAAINPENSTLLMVGYLGFGQRLFWEFKGITTGSFFKGVTNFYSLGGVDQTGQLEGVCFSPQSEVFLSNENYGGLKQQLWKLPYPIK